MSSIAQERLHTAVRNIMSGSNCCDRLSKAVQTGDVKYFLDAIAPVVSVYEGEAKILREQRQAALDDAELKRRALEFVAHNLGGSVTIQEPAIIDDIGRALGRKI